MLNLNNDMLFTTTVPARANPVVVNSRCRNLTRSLTFKRPAVKMQSISFD